MIMTNEFPAKDFMVALYDLLADNYEYSPRDTLDDILEHNIDDYSVDVNEAGEATIRLVKTDDKGRLLAAWRVLLQQTYRGEEDD